MNVYKLQDYCVRIYYEDTDFTGLVYHANYLKFFERAREEGLGIEVIKICYNKRMHMVVRSANIKYRSSAVHGDDLIIKTKCEIKRDKIFRCYQDIYKIKSSIVLVSAVIDLVTIDKYNKHIKFPQEILNSIDNNIE
jgi:acyl-CoA thioester hydrolase